MKISFLLNDNMVTSKMHPRCINKISNKIVPYGLTSIQNNTNKLATKTLIEMFFIELAIKMVETTLFSKHGTCLVRGKQCCRWRRWCWWRCVWCWWRWRCGWCCWRRYGCCWWRLKEQASNIWKHVVYFIS